MYKGSGLKMVGGRMTWSEASKRPGLVGEQAAYISCMYSALLRKVSRLVIHTPDTMWSCSDNTDCQSLSLLLLTYRHHYHYLYYHSNCYRYRCHYCTVCSALSIEYWPVCLCLKLKPVTEANDAYTVVEYYQWASATSVYDESPLDAANHCDIAATGCFA